MSWARSFCRRWSRLYANAEQNPGVLALEKQKEFEELQLKREKRNFLSFLNVNANYYYGNGTMSSHLYDESGMPIPQNYSRQSQSITTWAHRFQFRWKSCSICGEA